MQFENVPRCVVSFGCVVWWHCKCNNLYSLPLNKSSFLPVRKFFADSVLSLYKICPESRQNSFILYKEDTDPESAWKTVLIF
ncbi:hypothetical protein DPMN_033574 [Dreissena polymorpha]|uniref:Uncharacterized protein n=1 Tax=Dreissena polymorpha TaxID=45954 RepID=A0A9D4FHH4_DREPO|nr:hypothetical protein DPMN_150978 [Dreissena polymorpha]KAH3870388.1 hypothetical protein DPMN_033574 [Dreissena polymorpha]